MSINVVATTDYVEEKLSNVNTRIDDHNRQYAQTYFILTDTVNGHEYIVEIQDGNLVSYSRCVSIQVDKLPDKTSGYFKPDGLIITAVCEDGTTREIDNYTLSNVINGVVTVTYIEFSKEFITTFNSDTYNIELALQDFEYIENEDGTFTLTAWKQTLNGESSTEMVIPDLEDGLIIVEVV